MSSLRAVACGWTTHGVHQLLRGAEREHRVFPANAFLHEHESASGVRRVLYDTGYAPVPWRTGLAGWAYRKLLPPRVPPGATIGEQLDPATVTHVVLSHLHPDHIGGLAAFPHARVVVTEPVRRTMASPTLRDGLLGGLLPDWLESRLQVVPDAAFRTGPTGPTGQTDPTGPTGPAGPTGVPDAAFRAAGALDASGLRTADLFGDGTYLLVDLPGHAAGHVGALVDGRVLLAGDAAWGRDLLGAEHRIRALPRAVAHDHAAQADTARRLLAAEAGGVRLLFSHDAHPTDVDLLRTAHGSRTHDSAAYDSTDDRGGTS